jgi:putative nucleotidyltransferase with HDIG domain
MIRTFFDSRLALFVHLLTVLVIGFWAPNSYEFVFLNIIAGIAAIFSLTNSYRRGILFQTAVSIAIIYSAVYFAFSVIQEGNLRTIDYRPFLWFAGNGLLILTSYPLIFIFEKTFGFISESTLFELSDSNQPLLRKLSEKAPGTFQHSLQVANLAEEVIYEIGGNSLLVRTGALYHDIGKMTNPLFFIENQTGDFNPHDELEFEKSAEIIIGHVIKGVEIASKYKLPESIVDFIRTHHGTTLVQYFYRSFLKTHPSQEADMSRFSYPGPKPFSRETAIVMMADSVEASSRSLKVKNEESLKELVNFIINEQIRIGQFDDAQITFMEITRIKEILISKLINIHHVRIEYPH